jgi:hypothetical protein
VDNKNSSVTINQSVVSQKSVCHVWLVIFLSDKARSEGVDRVPMIYYWVQVNGVGDLEHHRTNQNLFISLPVTFSHESTYHKLSKGKTRDTSKPDDNTD